VTDVYVRADGDDLRLLASAIVEGTLHIEVASSYPLERAAEALAHALRGAAGAVVLEP
jgi:NADPH:quinone reductase-like Zn-dependent oxidoreductase